MSEEKDQKMTQNPENVRKIQGNPEISSRAHPGGPGLRREKDEKILDPPPRAERPGERRNVSDEGREPSPGRKLPPRATIKKGPPHQPPVRTKLGALSPPRLTRGGATRKIILVNLLKTRIIWKI